MAEEQRNLLQKLYAEQQLTESNVGVLRQQIEVTQVLLGRYQTGLMVLKELEGKSEGEEMLMNVGGSVFVQAKLVDPTEVTRALGSGVRIEQSLEEAKKGVERAVENLGKQYEALVAEHEKLVNRSAVLEAQMRQIAEQIQAQGAQQGV
ncbi:MAG: prefoldin subunit alpha [Candidatus Thorarchaeota archaeon]|jgi:prefoldin alpha subunit